MLKEVRWQGAIALGALVFTAGMAGWWLKHPPVSPPRTGTSNPDDVHASPGPAAVEYLTEVERGLLAASQALAEGRLTEAEATLGQLIGQEPRFRLAHALLADINRVRAGLNPGTIELSASEPALRSLLEEWRRRLSAPDHMPPPGSWPAGLVAFSPLSRHAFVVDAGTSRLYWLQRVDGGDGARLIASFYISVGKAGVGKEVEGDNKTPLGVYRIIARRPAADLPAFYGAGALVLDYPNPVDLSLRRTGSGIWLHGTPPDTYTREPLASEGCVALSNPDMRQLMEQEDILHAPVLIVRNIEWLDEASHRRQRDEALHLARDWIRTAVGLDPDLQALGVQRWLERDGYRYWRLEYRGPDPQQPAMVWFVRESDDGLHHVAGPRKPREPAGGSETGSDHTQNETAAAPGEPSAVSTSAPAAEDAMTARAAVVRTVQDWAEAWSARDVRRYLSHYHARFRPEDGLKRSDWEAQRRQRIEDKRRIEVDVLQPRVQLDGARATVTFIQRYRADGLRELRARKTLVLQRERTRWLILEERTR